MSILLAVQPALAQTLPEAMTSPEELETISREECNTEINTAVSVTQMLVSIECQNVMQAADNYIGKQNSEIVTLQELITQQDILLSSQQRKLSSFETEVGKWYRNPLYVGLLGILAGGLTVKMLER